MDGALCFLEFEPGMLEITAMEVHRDGAKMGSAVEGPERSSKPISTISFRSSVLSRLDKDELCVYLIAQ